MAEKPRIIFINPPLTFEERYGVLAAAGNSMPSLGLCSLAAIALRDGWDATIVEASSLNLTLGEVLRRIKKFSPNLIAITASTLSIFSAGKLAEEIKKFSQVPVMIGGPHFTAVPERTLKMFPHFDFGVCREGEETLSEILRSNIPADLSRINGVAWRDGEVVRLNAPREFIETLDNLPFPAFELLDNFPQAYRPGPFRCRRLPAVSLVTTRGCPNKCIFCDRSVFGDSCHGLSAEYVVNLIEYLQKRWGIREILFEDDTFVILKRRMVEFCEMLLKRGIDISWSCLGRVNAVNPEILRLMRSAGCWQISYGIESGSQDILNIAHKNIKLEQIRETLQWTRDAGLLSKGFFIVGHIGETKETLQQTINFALDIALDDISVSKMTPFPGTELYARAADEGTFVDDWSKMNLLQTVFVPKGLTAEDLDNAARTLLKKFYFRPRIMGNYLVRTLTNPRLIVPVIRGACALVKNTFSRK